MNPCAYVCYRTTTPIMVDGKLEETAWQAAPWTEYFVDIEGDSKPRPFYRTRVKMLWDDTYFYIAAALQEPHVWATLTEHDSVIFQDNDFEVFMDPDGDNHTYYEFEINALNTTWDLLLRKPYRDGGPAENSWEIPGMQHAVQVQGTLNDPSDTDKGWTIELAFPWQALAEYANRPTPPQEGDQWRVNFSRVEWEHEIVEGRYRKVEGKPEYNWVWSPQGVVDMHRPERWGVVQFSAAPPGSSVRFQRDPSLPARDRLMELYYAQRAFHTAHGRYTADLAELALSPTRRRNGRLCELRLTPDGYEAVADYKRPDGTRCRIYVRQDSRLY